MFTEILLGVTPPDGESKDSVGRSISVGMTGLDIDVSSIELRLDSGSSPQGGFASSMLCPLSLTERLSCMLSISSSVSL